MNTDPDLILADIVQHEMNVPADHFWVYGENVEAPKDKGLYIMVITGTAKRIGTSNVFDPATNEEVKGVSIMQEYFIEVTSKDRSALERKEEIDLALISDYGVSQMELQGVQILRTGDVLDLSFVEASKALKRYRIPCVMFYVKTKRTTVPYFNQFPPTIQEVEA
jgi:hypothetical protein